METWGNHKPKRPQEKRNERKPDCSLWDGMIVFSWSKNRKKKRWRKPDAVFPPLCVRAHERHMNPELQRWKAKKQRNQLALETRLLTTTPTTSQASHPGKTGGTLHQLFFSSLESSLFYCVASWMGQDAERWATPCSATWLIVDPQYQRAPLKGEVTPGNAAASSSTTEYLVLEGSGQHGYIQVSSLISGQFHCDKVALNRGLDQALKVLEEY